MFGEWECVDPVIGFPLRETAPQVVLEASGRLIAVLGGSWRAAS